MTRQSAPLDRVIVEEKLDGSCVLVRRQGGALVAFGREGRPCSASPNEGRRRFAAWVGQHGRRFAWLAEGERAACEWLMLTHGTRYALPHEPLVLIDVLTADGRRLGTDELTYRAAAASLPTPRVLHDGAALPVDEALARLGERGHHGAVDPAEGVVYRLEVQGAIVAVAKWVRHGKIDGLYLADHSGEDHVWNTWQDRAP